MHLPKKTEVILCGHSFSTKGIKAAFPRRSTPVRPCNLKQIQAKRSPSLPWCSRVRFTFHPQLRQNSVWKWGTKEETAFRQLQNDLISDRVMVCFDPTKPTNVVDTSTTGLGAILMQDGNVISDGSRALSDAETRYSQTKREMLKIVWPTEPHHLYLYGAKFTVITDHKPLIGISKSQKPASPRIDRWKLRLLPYHYKIIYRPG